MNGCSIDESSVADIVTITTNGSRDTSKAVSGRVIEFRFAFNVGSNYYSIYIHLTYSCIALICVIMRMAGVSNLFDMKFHLYVQYVCVYGYSV